MGMGIWGLGTGIPDPETQNPESNRKFLLHRSQSGQRAVDWQFG